MPERARRHDLVWLHLAGRHQAQAATACCAADAGAQEELAEWIAAGYPLIVSQQPPTLAADCLQLGLALPPARGKRRLAFVLPRSAVLRSSAPPLLRTLQSAQPGAASARLPAAWQPVLAVLLGKPAVMATEPRVYGSAGMQAVTGVDCVGAASDLDVLFAPPDWAAARALILALRANDLVNAQPRVDGEVISPAGDAVAWRELAGSSAKLLVKGSLTTRLIERQAFEASFATNFTARLKTGGAALQPAAA
ncbi:MAG: malonate decarboxylase holo-[acyl-carrier-protein] synthase [Burkholderiales bacterium RIFCSPHIGHO2_12_FULL_61_11]|nr:MAG: malonate decarboxylase holo-[acyl-carrier-protein] synthase [Burkholderiales bacterium RIFCSPHIGHO2_12_FULL_61_11]